MTTSSGCMLLQVRSSSFPGRCSAITIVPIVDLQILSYKGKGRKLVPRPGVLFAQLAVPQLVTALFA